MNELKPGMKTYIYGVYAIKNKEGLGLVKWYAPWRQYCFFPCKGTVWSKGCMQEITFFIDKIMEERKNAIN